jgi:photosystem II stability/assembly factor-like uncharacterized protein
MNMRKTIMLALIAFLMAAGSFWMLRHEGNNSEERDEKSVSAIEKRKFGEGEEKDEKRPNSWFYEQRAYPYQAIPQEKYLKALADAQLNNLQRRVAGVASTVWSEAGPTNIPGRISALAVHPSQPSIIYAGSAAGGVFKTTDLGLSWTPIFDAIGTYSIGAIAIHPNNPDIVYVGTGEASGAIDDYEGTGIYKSTDAGVTWANIGLVDTKLIGRILIDPLHPETLFVAALGYSSASLASNERGLYRSTNGGSTWTQALFVNDLTGCADVAMHPSTGTMFAAMYDMHAGPGSALWKSTNYGVNWTNIQSAAGLPAQGNLGRIGVSVDPGSNTVYASIVDGSTQGLMGVFKSTDLGTSWTLQSSLANHMSNFAWYFGQVRVAPNNPNIVYSLGVTLMKSSDGGASWNDVTNETHVDHHDLYMLPSNPNIVYNGSDGGVAYSTNGGSSWTVYRNMHNTQFYAMAMNPQNPSQLYGGTQDNGTNRTLTGGTGDWQSILGGDGFVPVVDYANPNIIYAEYQNGGISKSTDGGFSFSDATNGINPSEPHAWNTPIVMDPNNHEVLYTSTDRVYKTTDGAANWTAISPSLSTSYLTTIAAAKSSPLVVYAGSRTGTVYVTTNGGGAWTQIDGTLIDRWVTRLTVEPTDAGICYATVSGYVIQSESMPHVYRTTNYGSTWSDITSNLPQAPANDIIIDPHDNQTLYVGTDVGVYVSTNLGGSWSLLGTGMPITCVHDIEMNHRTRKLVAATHGRSMYAAQVACPGVTDTDADGVPDLCDNCQTAYNPDQADIDNDGIGDACDNCIDPDGDGFGNPGYPMTTCAIDNCPTIYNPDQTDLNGNGVGDACEYTSSAIFDTISTPCVSLVVKNTGNFGNGGTTYRSLDFGLQGDCASMYLYDGSPIILHYSNPNYILDCDMFSSHTFLVPAIGGKPTVHTSDHGDYEVFESGTFVTNDRHIAIEKTWYSPKQVDSCQFVIQGMKLYSWDGEIHAGLVIGEAIDWDIPSSSGSNNTGGFSVGSKLIYQRGTGTGCQDNQNRYGGMALIAIGAEASWADSSVAVYGAYTQSNVDYVYPENGFVPSEIYPLMQTPGFSTTGTAEDLHSVMTYFNSKTIGPTDTIYIYTVISSVRNGTSADLVTNVTKAKKWFAGHVKPFAKPAAYVCGDANGDKAVDISDVVYLIAYIFSGGSPPVPLEAGDANCDHAVDISDVVYLIAYIFSGGAKPCAACL